MRKFHKKKHFWTKGRSIGSFDIVVSIWIFDNQIFALKIWRIMRPSNHFTRNPPRGVSGEVSRQFCLWHHWASQYKTCKSNNNQPSSFGLIEKINALILLKLITCNRLKAQCFYLRLQEVHDWWKTKNSCSREGRLEVRSAYSAVAPVRLKT